jgi:hypothetical protein
MAMSNVAYIPRDFPVMQTTAIDYPVMQTVDHPVMQTPSLKDKLMNFLINKPSQPNATQRPPQDFAVKQTVQPTKYPQWVTTKVCIGDPYQHCSIIS